MRLLFTPVGPDPAHGCGPLVVDSDPEVLLVEVVEYPAAESSPSDRLQDISPDPASRPPAGSWRAVVGELEDARYEVVCPRCWSLIRASLGSGVTVRVLGGRPAGARCALCDPDDA